MHLVWQNEILVGFRSLFNSPFLGWTGLLQTHILIFSRTVLLRGQSILCPTQNPAVRWWVVRSHSLHTHFISLSDFTSMDTFLHHIHFWSFIFSLTHPVTYKFSSTFCLNMDWMFCMLSIFTDFMSKFLCCFLLLRQDKPDLWQAF